MFWTSKGYFWKNYAEIWRESMETCVVEVGEDKKILIAQNFDRLEELFGVKSTLKDGGSGDNQALCLHLHSPSGDQDSLQMAKVSQTISRLHHFYYFFLKLMLLVCRTVSQ